MPVLISFIPNGQVLVVMPSSSKEKAMRKLSPLVGSFIFRICEDVFNDWNVVLLTAVIIIELHNVTSITGIYAVSTLP